MFPGLSGAQRAADALYVEDVFSAFTDTGTGSSLAQVNGIDLATKGGMVWIKGRSGATDHAIYDTARGVQTDLTVAAAAETTQTQGVTAFNSNGFTRGTLAKLNTSTATYGSWTFRKAAKFFDVVTYTGNGAASRQIAHSLGVAPGMVIVKASSAAYSWFVQHRSIPATDILILNDTGAKQASAVFGNSYASDTTFTVDGVTGGNGTNQNGVTYVAYLFAHDTTSDGIIQCGSFTTDGSGNATVSLGWESQYVLVKRTDSTSDWIVLDTSRGWSLGTDNYLLANSTAAEAALQYGNPTAAGFFGTSNLANSATYVYMAIRKGLMRTPTDATKVFAINASTGTGATRTISGLSITTGPDLHMVKSRSTGVSHVWSDRLRGTASQLATNLSSAQNTFTDEVTSFNMDGITMGADASLVRMNNSGENYINYFLKEAKGFFSRVAFTGTGSAHTESHNLGVVPALMIVKCRSAVNDWAVYYGTNTNYLLLNSTAATAADSTYWNNTTPTSSVFTIGTNADVNTNAATYVAYLFATVAGVSKIDTYTGTGTTNQIDCGFSAGARFVLIKRTDSTGDWYYWDTTRGIIAGNDPYLLMNSTAAEATATDYIDSYNAGFELSSTAPAALNASGGTFLYLAIA